MSTATLVIGPEHVGQRMSLADFENVEVQEGYLYELGRGVVVVNQVPRPSHFFQVNALRRQLTTYEADDDSPKLMIAGGNDCKILLQEFGSERHPDIAIYLKSPPAGIEGSEVWAFWIPEIVVEVVSKGSRHRDYEEKPDEYLQFGIKEYWIVDVEQNLLTVLQRSRGKWAELKIKPPKKHTTYLLPGFELDIAAVFTAAGGA